MTATGSPSRIRAPGDQSSLAPRRFQFASQPGLGAAGMTLVVPLALALAAGLGSPERSLLVLGPLSTFALPIVVMIAFWWDDWPGTILRAPLSGLADTGLVVVGGVAATIAGQALISHVDLRGVFDPAAPAVRAPTFPGTMPLGAVIFVTMLEFTLVTEGWPLRRFGRFCAGIVALAVAWGAGAGLYEVLVRTGLVPGAEFGPILVCIGALQVTFYVLLSSWPFSSIGTRPLRLLAANGAVIAGGGLAYWLLSSAAGLAPARIGAVAGALVAAGLIVGMLFEGWLDSLLAPGPARVGAAVAATLIAFLLYAGLGAAARAASWRTAKPEDWTAYVGLNAIGAAIILHVAIGRRWPFAPRVKLEADR